MCDEHTAGDNDRFLASLHPSRRTFGMLAGAAGVAAMLPVAANAAAVKGRDVAIKTPDGTCDGYSWRRARASIPAC